MLKANAYGHGAVEVARRLEKENCENFGVALYEEAVELREAGIQNAQILVFAPMTEGSVALSQKYNLTPVVLSDGDLGILKSELKSGELKVHLKVNFEMNRMGFNPDKAREVINELQSMSSVQLTGLCTHFPTPENLTEENSATLSEISEFLEFVSEYDVPEVHALNSATLIGLHLIQDERIHQLGMRPGIALYGAVPDMGKHLNLPIEEAMTLCTQIMHLQNVKKGQGVSYLGQWKAPEDSMIGVLPIGYADGIRRSLAGKMQVHVNGKTCPQVGVICMDYIMVNLTHLDLDQPLHAEVQMTGIQEWADTAQTIPYEIMTGMSSRLPRVYE